MAHGETSAERSARTPEAVAVLGAAVAEHGDADVSATYLTSAPGQAA